MKPDTGVHHHALHPVLTHQDAALGVFCLVADMDTDTLEARNAHQIRQPLLELLRHGDEHMIRTLGDSRILTLPPLFSSIPNLQTALQFYGVGYPDAKP